MDETPIIIRVFSMLSFHVLLLSVCSILARNVPLWSIAFPLLLVCTCVLPFVKRQCFELNKDDVWFWFGVKSTLLWWGYLRFRYEKGAFSLLSLVGALCFLFAYIKSGDIERAYGCTVSAKEAGMAGLSSLTLYAAAYISTNKHTKKEA